MLPPKNSLRTPARILILATFAENKTVENNAGLNKKKANHLKDESAYEFATKKHKLIL